MSFFSSLTNIAIYWQQLKQNNLNKIKFLHSVKKRRHSSGIFYIPSPSGNFVIVSKISANHERNFRYKLTDNLSRKSSIPRASINRREATRNTDTRESRVTSKSLTCFFSSRSSFCHPAEHVPREPSFWNSFSPGANSSWSASSFAVEFPASVCPRGAWSSSVPSSTAGSVDDVHWYRASVLLRLSSLSSASCATPRRSSSILSTSGILVSLARGDRLELGSRTSRRTRAPCGCTFSLAVSLGEPRENVFLIASELSVEKVIAKARGGGREGKPWMEYRIL